MNGNFILLFLLLGLFNFGDESDDFEVPASQISSFGRENVGTVFSARTSKQAKIYGNYIGSEC